MKKLIVLLLMVKTLSSYNEILAKSNGVSLKEHSLDTVNIVEILLDSDRDFLKNKFDSLNLDFQKFEINLKKSSLFHDFGKASNIWQNKVRNHNYKEKLPPHAIYSGFFMFFRNEFEAIPLLSVSSHHSLLTDNSFGMRSNNIEFNDDYLYDLANSKNFHLDKFENINVYFNRMRKYIEYTHDIRTLHPKNNIPIDIIYKMQYCLSLIYLTMADGLSSYFEDNSYEISEAEIFKKFPTIENIKKLNNFSGEKTLTPIQYSIVSLNEEDLIKPLLLEAPCGEGKTLASLLFAEKLFEHHKIKKVIFALPTQITSNNMYFEFNSEYGISKEWIGIYHSEVLNFLNNIENDNFDINPYLERYQNLIYSKPFNISTIDHVLLSLFNGFKHAPKAFGNMVNSLIIIDELHYYDEYTLSLIEVLCDILRILKIPHIIMSATLPSFVKNRFLNERYNNIKSSGLDKKGIEKNPFEFVFHNDLIFDDELFSDKFLEIINENIDKNIGIIVNTVPQSKKIYSNIKELFPNKQVLLYNSQFMRKDRPIKELLLKYFSNVIYDKITESERQLLLDYGYDSDEKFIFIGTQVAEISLNMSFDIMISELAPLDAIIQRGGRLHRKMTFNNSKECNCLQCQKLDNNHKFFLHVFDTGEYCYPYYTKDDKEDNFKKNIINNSRNVLKNPLKFTFNNSIKMMDKVYENNSQDDNVQTNKRLFEEIIKDDIIFGGYPFFSEENGGQQRFLTRKIETINFSVLPKYFEYNDNYICVNEFLQKILENNNFEGKLNSEGLNEISKYMINVSNKFYFKNKSKSLICGESCFKIVDLDYNFDEGLFKDEENIS